MRRASSKNATKPKRAAVTTDSVQDYLAAIYDLAGSGKPVIGARLAKHMGLRVHVLTRSGDVGRRWTMTLGNGTFETAEGHRLLDAHPAPGQQRNSCTDPEQRQRG